MTPSLNSVSPTSYPASTGSQTMVLIGSDFAGGDTLTFIDPQGTSHASGAAKLTLVSTTEISFSSTTAATWAPGMCRSTARTAQSHSDDLRVHRAVRHR